MIARLVQHVTYANVASTLALVVALGTGTAYAANTIGSSDIIDGAVKTVDLASGAATSGKIRDAGVGTADLGDGAVTSSKIADGSVTAAELAPEAVTGPAIGVGAVANSEIAADAVSSSKIAAGAVGSSEVADGSLTANDIGTAAVGASEVADNALTFSDIAGGGSGGSVSLSQGAVANGRCNSYNIAIAGGTAGDAVVFSVRGPMQDGVFFYGSQVVDATTIRAQLCNFSGGTMQAFTNVPVRILTFR